MPTHVPCPVGGGSDDIRLMCRSRATEDSFFIVIVRGSVLSVQATVGADLSSDTVNGPVNVAMPEPAVWNHTAWEAFVITTLSRMDTDPLEAFIPYQGWLPF